jgi:hypothetical protein
MRESERTAIKPHHLIDILMDVGRGRTDWKPMPAYGHALHTVARRLTADRSAPIRVEIGIDDICEPCLHHVGDECDDVRGSPYPGQPASKMEWNLMLDRGWCALLRLRQGDELTVWAFCRRVVENATLDAMRRIYPGQPEEVTQDKFRNLMAGAAACGGEV